MRDIKKVTRDLKHDEVVDEFDDSFAFKTMTDCLNEASRSGFFPGYFKAANIISVIKPMILLVKLVKDQSVYFFYYLKYSKA